MVAYVEQLSNSIAGHPSEEKLRIALDKLTRYLNSYSDKKMFTDKEMNRVLDKIDVISILVGQVIDHS